MEQKLEITPDNYEGYCELRKVYYSSKNSMDTKSTVLYVVFYFILYFIAVFTNLFLIGIPVTIMMLATPFIITKKYLTKNFKKIKEKYPYVDTNFNLDDIENALKDVEILKYHRDGNILIEEIDIKGYLENIEKQKYINKCEKIKNNILNENKYENFQNDFCVDEEQLDKVKIKIKKLNRDL